jgi:hypothetical protein
MSLESWNESVTAQRGEYSQRKNAGLLMSGKESSSLQKWATPEARKQMGYHVQKNGSHTEKLGTQVLNWPTPAAHEARLGYQNRNNGKKGMQKSLTTVVIEDGQQDLAKINLNGKSRGSLNPNWTEQLMGIPVGWTQLSTEWIGSE